MSSQTLQAIESYYASWSSGTFDRERYNQAVAPDLEFRGSIDTVDGRDAFWQGVQEFAAMVESVSFHAKVIQGDSGFVLYDCVTKPVGVMRFAEHFKVVDGKISKIKLVFDSIKLRPLIEQMRGAGA